MCMSTRTWVFGMAISKIDVIMDEGFQVTVMIKDYATNQDTNVMII